MIVKNSNIYTVLDFRRNLNDYPVGGLSYLKRVCFLSDRKELTQQK